MPYVGLARHWTEPNYQWWVINHKRGAAVPKSPQQKSRWPIRLSQHAPTRPVSNNCPLGVSQCRSSAGRPAQGQGRVATTGEEGVRLVWSFRRLPTTTMTTSHPLRQRERDSSSKQSYITNARRRRSLGSSSSSHSTHHNRPPRGSAHIQPRRVWLCHRTGALPLHRHRAATLTPLSPPCAS